MQRSWGSKVAATISASMVVLALLFPAHDFDLFTFVGVVQRYDHSAEVALERTKAELRASLSDERYRWITGADDPPGYAYAVATRPEVFDAQLRWFYGRPLFTRLAWAITKLGVPTPSALHGISLLSGALLAYVLFRLTRVLDPDERGSQPPFDYDAWRRHLRLPQDRFIGALRLGFWILLVGTTDVWGVTRSPLSDAFAMLFVALGFDALISWQKHASAFAGEAKRDATFPYRATALLFVSISARVDNSLYVVTLAAFLMLRELLGDARVRSKTFLFSVGTASAATLLAFWINRRSYGIRKLIYFRRVYLELLPAEAEMPLSITRYVSILLDVLRKGHLMEILFVSVLVGWVFSRRRRLASEPIAVLGFLMLPLSLARFLLFPDLNTRFFIVPFSLFVLAVVLTAIPPSVTQGFEATKRSPGVPETK